MILLLFSTLFLYSLVFQTFVSMGCVRECKWIFLLLFVFDIVFIFITIRITELSLLMLTMAFLYSLQLPLIFFSYLIRIENGFHLFIWMHSGLTKTHTHTFLQVTVENTHTHTTIIQSTSFKHSINE